MEKYAINEMIAVFAILSLLVSLVTIVAAHLARQRSRAEILDMERKLQAFEGKYQFLQNQYEILQSQYLELLERMVKK